MIGTSAFLIHLMYVVGGLFFMGVGIGCFIKSKQKSIFIFIGFGTIFFLIATFNFVEIIKSYSQLSGLEAQEIARIRVGDQVVSEPGQLRIVVNGLRNMKWFFPDHGGWAETILMGILFKSGEKQLLQVGYYLRQEGAVVGFLRLKGTKYYPSSATIYAFCPELPKALLKVGIHLPKKKKH